MNRRLVIGKSTDKYLAALVTGHDHFQLIEVNHQKHTKLAEVFKVGLMIREASNLDIRRVQLCHYQIRIIKPTAVKVVIVATIIVIRAMHLRSTDILGTASITIDFNIVACQKWQEANRTLPASISSSMDQVGTAELIVASTSTATFIVKVAVKQYHESEREAVVEQKLQAVGVFI